MTVDDKLLPPRPLPVLTPENTAFLTGGHDGRLLIMQCRDCDYYLHPPTPVCGRCLSTSVAPTPVSGRGTVYSYTISEYAWHPAFPPPYVIALVALEEQPELRLTSDLLGCPPERVRVGLPVRVTFVDCGEIALPVFAAAA